MAQLELGKAVEVRRGERVAILSFGTLLPAALAAADKLNATVVDMRWVKPIDKLKVLELAEHHELLVTVEENAVAGGAGSYINELLLSRNPYAALLNLGLPDDFVEHGDHTEQLAWVGLESDAIVRKINATLKPGSSKRVFTFDTHAPVELGRNI